jgi:hypothetical protein
LAGLPEELARLIEQGERAYTAMYDARRPKDDYEDACVAFGRAVDLARSLNLPEEADRLQKRLDGIMAVYNSQFRGF